LIKKSKEKPRMDDRKKSFIGLGISSIFIIPHIVVILLGIIGALDETSKVIIRFIPISDIIGVIIYLSLTPWGITFFIVGIISSLLSLFINTNKKWIKILLWLYLLILIVSLGISIWWQATGMKFGFT
jgi:hypothetical protein